MNMVRVLHRDVYGFLVAALITTLPLVMAVAVGEAASKEGFSRPWLYVLATALGAFAAVPASAVALLIGHRSTDRLGHHAVCAILVSLLTFLAFCTMVMPAVDEMLRRTSLSGG
jgi:hypothetical protein